MYCKNVLDYVGDDIKIRPNRNGRPLVLKTDEGDLIENVAQYYIDEKIPHTNSDILDLVQDVVRMLSPRIP